ncbi:MAG: ABC transporter permease [Deinococcales bacterium]
MTNRPGNPFLNLLSKPAIGPLIALLIACIFFATQSDRFLSGRNFSLIVQQVSVVGALAIGQTLIILTAGIDLSNGLVMALGGVLMTRLAFVGGLNPYLAILVGLAATTGFGLLNGLLVTRLRLPPFIVTLGTLNIAFALTRIYTVQTTRVPSGEPQVFLGQTFKLGETAITYGSIFLLILVLIVWFILQETPIGRHIYAVGNDPEAARLAGIRVNYVLLGVYTAAGFIYGLAALLQVARTGVGDPQAGQNGNLESITAVVLGGTSLFGGRGTVLGTLVGALIVGVFRNGLQLMGVDSIYQVLITGILVILAVAIDQMGRRRA